MAKKTTNAFPKSGYTAVGFKKKKFSAAMKKPVKRKKVFHGSITAYIKSKK